MLAEMAQWLVDTILQLGYVGIFLLMSIESSFIPFPSEVVLIPAGYLVSQQQMSLTLLILSATAGSLTGAYINYYLARFVGLPFLLKYGRYIFISVHTLTKLETFFLQHGAISTFTGRLIPGIRQLISIPAGLSKMNIVTFSIYTAMGATLWALVLIALGYILGENEALIKSYLHEITLITLGVVILLLVGYVYLHRRKSKQ